MLNHALQHRRAERIFSVALRCRKFPRGIAGMQTKGMLFNSQFVLSQKMKRIFLKLDSIIDQRLL